MRNYKTYKKLFLVIFWGILSILFYPHFALTDDKAIDDHRKENGVFSLEIGVHGNGEAVISGNGTYKNGEVVSLYAKPSSGWVFKSWDGDVEPEKRSNKNIYITVDTNKKIILIFNPDKKQPEHVRPQFRYDSVYTGLSKYEGPKTVRKAWGFPVKDIIDGTPAIDRNGNIYFGAADNDKNVYKLNGKTGEMMWSFQTGKAVFSSPALDNNLTVYIGGLDKHFYAINGFTGKLIWDIEAPAGIYSSPFLSKDEKTVYFGCSRKDHSNDPAMDVNRIYALSTVSGLIVWQKDFQFKFNHKLYSEWGEFLSCLIISDDRKILYASNPNGIVYALDSDTGNEIWKFDMGATTWCSPGLGPDGILYVGSFNHMFYALDGLTGQLKWKFQAGKEFVSSPAIDAKGNVFCGNHDGNVYAFNSKTGEILWAFQTGLKVEACPLIDKEGRLYVGSKNGILYALNTADGTLIWKYDCHENDIDKHITIYGSVAIGLEKFIYVGIASQRTASKMIAFKPLSK